MHRNVSQGPFESDTHIITSISNPCAFPPPNVCCYYHTLNLLFTVANIISMTRVIIQFKTLIEKKKKEANNRLSRTSEDKENPPKT